MVEKEDTEVEEAAVKIEGVVEVDEGQKGGCGSLP